MKSMGRLLAVACAAALASTSYAAASVAGGSASRRNQVQLRAGPLVSQENAAWATSVRSSLAAVELGAPQQGNGDGHGNEKQPAQPVQVQVPEEEMKKFVAKLSSGCGKRFTQLLEGKGPQLHTFGAQGATDEGSCTQLNGTICATEAHITEDKATGGRTMQSTVDVEGNGCLPNECMAKDDLGHLTEFMHSRAKDTIPGTSVEVTLSVDCSKSGGSKAVMGGKNGRGTPGLEENSGASGTRPVAASLISAALAFMAPGRKS